MHRSVQLYWSSVFSFNVLCVLVTYPPGLGPPAGYRDVKLVGSPAEASAARSSNSLGAGALRRIEPARFSVALCVLERT
jgi:hypothetical protein